MPDTIIDTKQERYAACTGYIRRSRWLSVIAAALSGILLLNLYLESNNLQELQLIDAMARRDAVDERIRGLERDVSAAAEQKKADLREYERLSLQLGELKYLRARTDNTISGAGLESRILPVLGLPITVAAEDFAPVLCIGIGVFTLGLWLSLRFVEFTVLELKKANELEEVSHLIRLHFNFSMPLKGGLGDKIATFVQYGVLVIPMFAALASGSETLSMTLLLSGRDFDRPEHLSILAVRSFLLSMTLLFVVVLVAANLNRVLRLDRELRARSPTTVDSKEAMSTRLEESDVDKARRNQHSEDGNTDFPKDTTSDCFEEVELEKANRNHYNEGASTDSPKDTEPQAEADS